jgi:hypothetical protein
LEPVALTKQVELSARDARALEEKVNAEQVALKEAWDEYFNLGG